MTPAPSADPPGRTGSTVGLVVATGLLAFVALALGSATADGVWPAPQPALPWWLLALLFAAAELGRSRPLAERSVLSPVGARVPLLLGFYLASPLTVLGAQLLGTAIVLAARWPQERRALARVIVGSGLVTATGLLAFVALAAAPPTSVVDGWLDSGVSIVVVAAIARIGASGVIANGPGDRRPPADESWSAEFAALAVGLGAVTLIGLDPAGVVLVVAGAVAAAGASWHADRTSRRSDALERFHRLVGELEFVDDRSLVLAEVLEEVRRLSRSAAATLALHGHDGVQELRAGTGSDRAPRPSRLIVIGLDANGAELGQLALERTRWQPAFSASDRDVIGLVSSCLVGSLRIAARLTDLERRHATEQRRSEVLDRANHELRRSDEARSLSLSITSHELRAPLTALLAEAELLPHLIDDPGQTAVVDRLLRDVGGNARLLLRLVDDLVELARLESGQLHLRMEPLDLRRLIGEIVAPFERAAAAAGTSFAVEVPEPVVVTADPDRIRQVVTNLLENARGVTGAGDTIRVELGVVDGCAQLAVEDSGPGIGADDLDRIFEPFERGTSSRRGGLGLGLAIARQLVAGHGGELVAASRPGSGSTFLVKLPVAGFPEATAARRASVEAGPDHAQQPVAG